MGGPPRAHPPRGVWDRRLRPRRTAAALEPPDRRGAGVQPGRGPPGRCRARRRAPRRGGLRRGGGGRCGMTAATTPADPARVARWGLIVLTLVNLFNYLDRFVLSALV